MMNKKGPLAMQDIATNKLNLLCLANVWLGACLLGVASFAAAGSPHIDQMRLETGAPAKVIDTGGTHLGGHGARLEWGTGRSRGLVCEAGFATGGSRNFVYSHADPRRG